MMRTSIYLPDTLHQRLHMASKRKGKSVSKLVRELLDRALAVEEGQKLDSLYEAWEDARGCGKAKTTNLSTSIDEILYGENGAWRGSEPE